MTKTVTGDFGSKAAMANAMDDLLSSGYPREKVFMDTEHMQLKVITADVTEREVHEILMRHKPTNVH